MSLKAKLEAVIYAAEEPVTLTQLAALFAAEAVEWKSAQEIGAGQAAETEDDPRPSLGFLSEDLNSFALADAEPLPEQAEAQAGIAEVFAEINPATEPDSQPPAIPEESAVEAPQEPANDTRPVQAAPADLEAEVRRLARQRDREVKGILKQLLDELIASTSADGRGVEIREIAGGYRMATKPECHDAVRLFVKSLKPAMKLSLPALETLAVVAYKQPVTAPEVNEIRGVESVGVLASLLARKLIATAGRKPVIGRPILYKTTKEFLLRFGLKDLNELPSMEEFEKMAVAEIEEMEPEAVAADAAEDAAELEVNSPSGEELAEAFEVLESNPGLALEPSLDGIPHGSETPYGVASTVPGSLSDEQEAAQDAVPPQPAEVEPTEPAAAQAAQDEAAVTAPSEPDSAPTETEAHPDAQKDEEKH